MNNLLVLIGLLFGLPIGFVFGAYAMRQFIFEGKERISKKVGSFSKRLGSIRTTGSRCYGTGSRKRGRSAG